MPRATLILDADTSAIRRAMGEIPGIVSRAQGAATAAERRGANDRARIARDEARAQERAAEIAARKREREERSATRAAEAEERRRLRSAGAFAKEHDRIHQQLARARERAEQAATRAAEREGRRRVQADASFAREHDRIHAQMMRERQRREAQATRERRQREREWGGRIGGVVNAVAGGAMGYAADMHGQIQGARQSRALANRTLGNAVRNAGGSTDDAARAQARVRAFAEQTGMEYTDVANALSIGQARGSSLEAGEGRTPAQALEESLAIIREANAEGADPGQYLAARGRLAAAGLRGDSLKGAMRFALAAAQSGQVEVDQLLSQGLPGATQLMEARVNALGPGATEAQRQATRLAAWRESVSTQEVLAASGGASRQTSNTLAGLQNFMNTPRRQEMLLGNIQAAESQINTATPEGRARAAALRALYEGNNALFERDPTRTGNAMRLRAGVAPAEFATRVATATGGNAQAAANLFAGGGQGNPQALLANMRALFAVLGSERGQRIQQMMGGAGLTDARIAEHQAAVEGDDLARLTRAQEAGANALTDNTRELVQLSSRFADWATAHPFEATAVKHGVDTAKSAVEAATSGVAVGAGRAAVRRMMGGSPRAGQSLVSRMGGRAARVLTRWGGPVMAALDILTTNSNERGVEEGGVLEAQAMARVRDARRAQHAAPGGSQGGAVQVSLTPESAQAVGTHTAAALQRATIQAVVQPDPHATAHQASAAPPAGGRPAGS